MRWSSVVSAYLLAVSLLMPVGMTRAQDLSGLLSDAARETLARLIATHEVVHIDLDDVPTYSISPTSRIGTSGAYTNDSLFLGSSRGIDLSNDTLLVSDYVQQAVLLANTRTLSFSEQHGVSGTGPGEFRTVQSAFFSKSHYFVSDANAGGLHVFTKDHKYVTRIPTSSQLWFSNDAGGAHVAISPEDDSRYLIEILSPAPPFSRLGQLLPRLTPREDPADGYNMPVVALNNTGEMALSYYGIPFVFLYNARLELTSVIQLTSNRIASMNDNAESSFGKYSISSWLFALALSDDGQLAISTNAGITLINTTATEARPVGTFELKADATTIVPFDIEYSEHSTVFVVTRGSSVVYEYTW